MNPILPKVNSIDNFSIFLALQLDFFCSFDDVKSFVNSKLLHFKCLVSLSTWQ